MIHLSVDGRIIEAVEEISLLHACLEKGIYIPNLCSMGDMERDPVSCRLCFVEVEGRIKPVCSCKVAVTEGMIVRTNTEAVRKLQRTALRLLLTVHNAECKHCPSNKNCELQRMAKFLGVRLRPRRFEHLDRGCMLEQGHSILAFVPDRCVLCEKCIRVCIEHNSGKSLLTLAKRGLDTIVTSVEDEEQSGNSCADCRKCVDVCPVSAILLRDHGSPTTTIDSRVQISRR